MVRIFSQKYVIAMVTAFYTKHNVYEIMSTFCFISRYVDTQIQANIFF